MQPVRAFLSESGVVHGHEADAQLSRIQAPTLLTVGRHDVIISTRFASPLQLGIRGAELVVFAGSAHAPIYEQVDELKPAGAGVLAAAYGGIKAPRSHLIRPEHRGLGQCDPFSVGEEYSRQEWANEYKLALRECVRGAGNSHALPRWPS